jgi:queuine tRNA-ribosyltransferase
MADPLATPRGTLVVPTFLPDATRAGVRGVSSEDLRRVGIEGVVVNAFHLLRRPGARVVQAAGGIHRFMDWDGPILSDSGGFQIWSLIRQDPNRGVIRDNEVIFREPSTGEKWNLTPERVIGLQLQLGSDIMVCLDDCTDAEAPEAEQARSVERTVAWAKRCREELNRQTAQRRDAVAPRIFAVVQGGGIERLRRQCAAALADIGFDGYGFGGWPLAADGSLLVDPLRWVAETLPAGTPKHALGIGRPDHVVAAFALGYSIFDCALPTRDARHGRLYAFKPGWASRRPAPGDDFYRAVRIHDARYRVEHGPIEDGCDCPLCARHSAAYLHHLFKVGDLSAERLATLHNLRFYVRLFELLRLT